MAISWTNEQKSVIHTRGKNILVSAAAGSGKTAVLVERIMSRITSDTDPVSIDELLIVTFTKAAAGEMRTRILSRLEDAAEQDPDNAYLADQVRRVGGAQITTIDGFCSYVIRNYGQSIGLAPGFRVAEEGETKLMKKDAVSAVLEEAYASADPDEQERFGAFVETFATGKTDASLEDLILRVFEAAESSPDPQGWLEHCHHENEASSPETLLQTDWMGMFREAAEENAEMAHSLAEKNAELAHSPEGPSAYIPTGDAYARLTEHVLAAIRGDDFYRKTRLALYDTEIPPLGRKKPAEGENPDLRDTFKETRDAVKKIIDELKEQYFFLPPDDAAASLRDGAGPLDMLLDLAERMRDRYAEMKEEKNILDFSDLEHNALQILRKDGERTYAARELAGQYREVMIDEYQDSNYLQEAILTAVSRIEDGEPDYFCVGDVKQSIYSFRQARPKLFMEKYHSYKGGTENGVRIDLHRNFRSRREVVDTVNGIFRQIMRIEVGGVDYDDDAALVKGAVFADTDEHQAEDAAADYRTEIMPVFTNEDADLMDDAGSASARELEARAVGTRIRRMVGHEKLLDQKTGELRPVRYEDIVILLRTTAEWSDVFMRVLDGMHIPCYTSSKEGYFGAIEVVTVLNYLRIIDNPQQDIPFTAVLTSAFAGLEAEDLARVRARDGAASYSGSTERANVSMYDAARFYALHGEEPALRARLEDFFAFFDSVRASVHDTPLHELIDRVITESGFGEYAAALPGGLQRTVNLRMLVDKAIAFEHTSYIGLFNFVRYIENLQKENVDFGELSTITEHEDVVRIYSIHKSKGLEYPVVFVCGMGKKFNTRELKATVLIHPEMGVASDYVDFRHRVRVPTLKKCAVKQRLLRDRIGEELRVLYVALTRAKQKLILTGSLKNEESFEHLSSDLPLSEPKLSAGFIVRAGTFWDWVIPAAKRMLDAETRAGLAQMTPEEREKMLMHDGGRRLSGSCLVFTPVRPSDLAADEVDTQVRRADALTALGSVRSARIYDADMRTLISERASWTYPFAGSETIPVEVSVSELKTGRYSDKDEEFAENDDMARLYPEPEDEEPTVPEFIRQRDMRLAAAEAEMPGETAGSGKKKTSGAAAPVSAESVAGSRRSVSGAAASGSTRGTAYHRVMQLISFAEAAAGGGETAASADPGTTGSGEQISSAGSRPGRAEGTTDRDRVYRNILEQLGKLEKSGKISAEEAGLVDLRRVASMAASPMGRRMAEAERRGDLYREQPFVLGVAASEIRSEWPDDEMIFVQGIIDAFFYEEDGIVLLDYKTDRVRNPEELADRYRVQLTQYREALERVTGKDVKETYIWSFRLGRAILM
ncbi:MAG: helicase-exonuclease AddAB subunit AddA [Eubacteriales bacterium]